MTIPQGSTGSGAPTGEPPQQGNQQQGNAGNPSGAPAGEQQQPTSNANQQQVDNPAAQRYAQEAATERKARQAAEARLKELEDAGKSELERWQSRAQQNELLATTQALELQEARLSTAISDAKAAAGINPSIPAAHLARLLDGIVTFDDKNRPLDVAKALRDLVKDNAYLAVPAPAPTPPPPGAPTTPPSPTPPVSSGAPVNPGRSNTPGGWTWDAISSISAAQYAALSDAQKSEMSQFIFSHPRPAR